MQSVRMDIGRLVFPLLLIGLWQVIYLIVQEPAMSSPLSSVKDLTDHWFAWASDVGVTLGALLVSFIISAVFGIILGFSIGLSAFWSQTLGPLILGVYSIPKITLYPIFLLIFGLTMEGRVAFSVFHGIFPILIICMEATQMVPKIYLKLARCYNMTFVQKAKHIIIPFIMPQLVAGLRMGFSLCFIGLILAEMFASYKGIGYRLNHFMSANQVSSIFALFLIIVFIAFLFTYLFLTWQERNEKKIGKLNNKTV